MRLFVLLAILAICALGAPILMPRAEAPPALRDADGYLTNVERAVFNGPLDDVIAHLRSDEGNVLNFVTRTERIAEIEQIIPVEDEFPNPNAVRIVALSDGSQVTERVLENSDATFAYQIWGFTSGSARPIDHIKGVFTYEERDDGTTEVVWTYAVAPRVFWARPFIQGFLDNDFAPFMESGLTGAAETFNAPISG